MNQPFHFYPEKHKPFTLPIDQPFTIINIIIPVLSTNTIHINSIKTKKYEGEILYFEIHLYQKKTDNEELRFLHLKINGIPTTKLMQFKIKTDKEISDRAIGFTPEITIDKKNPDGQYKYAGINANLQNIESYKKGNIKYFDISNLLIPDSCTIPPGGGE